jgi:hypothetical protein
MDENTIESDEMQEAKRIFCEAFHGHGTEKGKALYLVDF